MSHPRSHRLALWLAGAASCGAALASAAPILAQSSGPAQVQKLKKLYFDGKIDDAEKEALKHLEAAPNDVDVRIVLANCYHRRAMDLSKDTESVSLEPGQETPGAQWFAKSIQELKEALHTVEEARKKDPSIPRRSDIWLGLCQIEQEARDIDGLVDCTAETAAKFADDSQLMDLLRENVRPFVIRQEYDKAAAVLQALAEHTPRNRDTLLALGRAQYLSGKRAEGISTIGKVLDFDSGEAEAQYQMAELSAYEGDFKKAARYFAPAARQGARQGLAQIGLVTAMHTFDRHTAIEFVKHAENKWKVAKRSAPSTMALNLNAQLGKLLQQSIPSALDVLEVARMLSAADFQPGALAELQVALTIDRGMAEALFLQANVYARLFQHDRAAASLAKGLEVMEHQPERTFGVSRDELLSSLGKEQFRLGRFEDALASFSKLSNTDPYAYEIALTNDRLGRQAEAARLFHQVVEKGADPQQVDDARRRLASPSYQNLH